MSTFKIYELEAAQTSLLKRVPPDEISAAPQTRERIAALFGEPLSPEQAVARIIADVRSRGDDALQEWSAKLDGAAPQPLRVPPEAITQAAAEIPAEVRDALRLAAERVEFFYRKQRPGGWLYSSEEGMLGQLVTPLDKVGVYVPGGTAPLPSSLIMAAVPAQVAGVGQIVVCTPPGAGGSVPAVVLAAAYVAGVEHLYQVGGAQAIAAMAYGTQSVPQVDKIVGPGGLFVTLAKRQVYGVVGIDGLLGPTETVVIADSWANPALIAADLLAQAEHDLLASAILITPDRDLAERVSAEVEAQLARLSRENIAVQALAARGGAVIVPDLAAAFEVANRYAPEHLQLSVEKPNEWLGRVRNAGAVFLGEHSFEVLGDYVAGPSHSLPTGGTARFASGINVTDFLKITAVIGLNQSAAAELSQAAATLAEAESLTAHAAAARARTEEGGG